ncbi:hypothetical protein N7470_001763 [Penicillium chermesinum]|nr:hypothetical protein N7470_001763 [Penicillium chermesinum]
MNEQSSCSDEVPQILEGSFDLDKRRQHVRSTLKSYLLEHSPEFQTLSQRREQGWRHPAGDTCFSKKRKSSDKASSKDRSIFRTQLKHIGTWLHACTGVFRLPGIGTTAESPTILDMCMAPGAFLEIALKKDKKATAAAFTLPEEAGGFRVILPEDIQARVNTRFLDINMLATDMGIDEIEDSHPDAGKFLPTQFKPDEHFDLVICDGQVLRAHARAPYREAREASRLTIAQLALGLEHLKPGGSMLVLLHNFERWEPLNTVWRFSKFASQSAEALSAVARWKKLWRAITFGSDQEYRSMLFEEEPAVEEFLDDFGPEIIRLGATVWQVQRDALGEWLEVLDRRREL